MRQTRSRENRNIDPSPSHPQRPSTPMQLNIVLPTVAYIPSVNRLISPQPAGTKAQRLAHTQEFARWRRSNIIPLFRCRTPYARANTYSPCLQNHASEAAATTMPYGDYLGTAAENPPPPRSAYSHDENVRAPEGVARSTKSKTRKWDHDPAIQHKNAVNPGIIHRRISVTQQRTIPANHGHKAQHRARSKAFAIRKRHSNTWPTA